MGAVIKAARARLEGKAIDGKALSDKVRDRLTPNPNHASAIESRRARKIS